MTAEDTASGDHTGPSRSTGSENHARSERAAICDLLTALGPDQPTLCEGWHTRDLAAHLILRERRPLASLGIVLPPLAGRTARVQRELAQRPFPDLVATLRTPPRWSPRSLPQVERVTDTLEMFIHHEDIRRAQPEWAPRNLPAGLTRALWAAARGLARLRLRRIRGTVVLDAPGHGQVRGGRGGDEVRLTGAPGELVLFLSGRQRAARVALTGPADLADRLRHARFGL